MPFSPLRACSYPGCQTLVKAGRCAEHQVTTGWERDEKRQRLYGRRWQAFRRTYLADNPWCVECQRAGVFAPSTEVDHLVDHKGDSVRFWAGPFQALCKSHHSQKTAQELGGGGIQNFGDRRGRAQMSSFTKKNPNVGNSRLNGTLRLDGALEAENTLQAARVGENLVLAKSADESLRLGGAV